MEKLLFCLCLTFLVGCNQLPLNAGTSTQAPVDVTFNKSVLVAVTSITELRQTAIILLQSNLITVDKAQQAQDIADQSRVAIDAAIALNSAGKFADAQSGIYNATNILLLAKAALLKGQNK